MINMEILLLGGDIMNGKILGFFVSLFAFSVLILPMSAVFATMPTSVSGITIPAGPLIMEERFVGNNIIRDVSGSQLWIGSFEGFALFEGRWIIHKNDVTTYSVYTLDVTHEGKMGTLTIVGAEGNWRIISGTGDLVNLRGQGTFYLVDPIAIIIGYEGQVHFEP
jgi:hypothetical protein